MADMRDRSRGSWLSDGSVEHINAGSLQRIADAVETMAKSYDDVRRSRDYYQSRCLGLSREVDRLNRRIRSLRGVITRMKRHDDR